MSEQSVYQRIRSILMAYRCLWRSESDKPYEWPKLAGDIIIYMEGDFGDAFPANSLENFVRGLPHPDKKKRALGLRKYSIPRPDRVEAMIEFLTNPDSKGYACEKEVLLAKSRPIVPLQLQEVLNEQTSSPAVVDINHLQGQFTCPVTGSDYVQENILQILDIINPRLAMVGLMKYKVDMSVPKKGKPKNKTTPESYSGWAMLTSEDNILMCVQHMRDKDNCFYLSMGIDNAVYRKERAQVLVFLEHDYPDDTITISSTEDEKKLRDNIINAWSDKLRLFRKTENNN